MSIRNATVTMASVIREIHMPRKNQKLTAPSCDLLYVGTRSSKYPPANAKMKSGAQAAIMAGS
jgi:hypothetical protein